MTPDLGPMLRRDQRLVHSGGIWSILAGASAGLGALVCFGGCIAGIGTGRVDDWMLAAGGAALVAGPGSCSGCYGWISLWASRFVVRK